MSISLFEPEKRVGLHENGEVASALDWPPTPLARMLNQFARARRRADEHDNEPRLTWEAGA
jgi:hypothetical protein